MGSRACRFSAVGGVAVAALLFCACGDSSQNGSTRPDAAPWPDGGGTHLVESVTHHGVTWTFSEPVRVGRFITGDFYVVGPVTVVDIYPPPENGRNGSVPNIPPTQSESGWDDRVAENRYEPGLRVTPPIGMVGGDEFHILPRAKKAGP